jgi:hypothetical protein
MSQAALWQVMRMFKIPDVDLLEQIYEGATVRLAPNEWPIRLALVWAILRAEFAVIGDQL